MNNEQTQCPAAVRSHADLMAHSAVSLAAEVDKLRAALLSECREAKRLGDLASDAEGRAAFAEAFWRSVAERLVADLLSERDRADAADRAWRSAVDAGQRDAERLAELQKAAAEVVGMRERPADLSRSITALGLLLPRAQHVYPEGNYASHETTNAQGT